MRQSSNHGTFGPSTSSHPARNLPRNGDVATHKDTGGTKGTRVDKGNWLPGDDEPVSLEQLIEDVKALRATVAGLTALVLARRDQLDERSNLGAQCVDLAPKLSAVGSELPAKLGLTA